LDVVGPDHRENTGIWTEVTQEPLAASSAARASAAAMLQAEPSWQTEFTRSNTLSDIKQFCSPSSSDSRLTASVSAPLRALFSRDKFAMAFLTASDRLVAKLLEVALSKLDLFTCSGCRKPERAVVVSFML